jgi:hypothetical protein
MAKKKIGLVMPVLNYFEGACEVLASVKTMHDWTLYIQPQWRGQVPLSRAWNDGSRQAFNEGCDYALVCNDDIMFAPETIDNMVAEYERLSKENVIMVTPNNINGQLPSPHAILDYKIPADQVSSFSDHPNFSCFLITPEYFETVGYFDHNFNPAWYEDNDSHRRAMLLGLREITTTAAPMVHLGSQTTARMPNPDSGPSEAYYIEKWGGIPESHLRPNQKEHFTTPFNDPNLTVRDWRGNPYV